MKIISLLIIVFAIVAAIFVGGDIRAFIDVPSLLVVIGPVIASISAKHGLEGFKELFREGENQSKILHTMGVTGIIAGAIGTMIGFIIMLGNLSDQSALGPALAIALLTLLYGLLIFLFTTLLSTKNFGEK
ncbi:MotA/TolQ/ExbB proton channel family protein [Bacteriovoracales bacterium]|nr:MotA/TolQ/ExbB proton channel family protein [Bacteriovoracales bacterium]